MCSRAPGRAGICNRAGLAAPHAPSGIGTTTLTPRSGSAIAAAVMAILIIAVTTAMVGMAAVTCGQRGADRHDVKGPDERFHVFLLQLEDERCSARKV